ncbi:MAG TPA: ABC transporter ATP-binding protein [Ferruginibacter sp.]|nr:ABC transporter ATP-binding protein [Ferruginibacter sp.]HRO05461.1 ABC transporter ATP-binding protein [Ferruginibacter sp.]HRO96177.1 ABC transporter ATP-binding protein [Ferruginibacter sp.]HRP48938.1 ABC transporter ATP-binding protein [Ferruginibacter sp.]
MSKPKKTFNLALLKRVYRVAAPYKNKFYLSLFLAVLLAVLAPIRPWLIQITIHYGIENHAAGWWLKGAGAFLIEITVIQILLLLIDGAARFWFAFTSARLGQYVVRDLRVSTYKKILNLNVRQYDTTPIGTLTTRTINDIESVNDIFSDGLIPIIADLLAILSILGYMFAVDWKLTLVCLAPFPVLIIATYFFKESVNKSFIRVRNAVASLNAFVQEHITGMPVVQAFAAEQQEQRKFEKINTEHKRANIRAIFAYSVFFPLVELVSAASIGLLVWWAGRESVFAGAGNEVAGVITAFILCLNLLFRPLRVMADKFNVLQMGMIASERVFKVLDNEDVTPESGTATTPIHGAIEFRNVSFEYNEGTPVLKNVSFSIPAGKTLAIVGSTGSGKTTITSLINRLYPVSQGEILIDGVSVNDYELSYLRSRIGVVLQEVYLFSGTIRDNLTLRNRQISEDAMVEATKLVDLHPFIMNLPGGYDFNVRERGAVLSMGQRQLLSFARAVLYNPSVLILDEATSSVDGESEALIQQAIDKLIAGRTSIVIAHRLSTIRKADRILMMDRGTVAEWGTHEELMEKQGAYYRLYQTQFSQSAVV